MWCSWLASACAHIPSDWPGCSRCLLFQLRVSLTHYSFRPPCLPPSLCAVPPCLLFLRSPLLPSALPFFQVGQRKGLPHIIFCQVFRWPELSSHHEVRAIASCQYSFYAKREEVCINPYHYHRTLVPPVVVPSGALGALPTGAGQAIGGGGGGGDTGMLPSLDNLSLQEGGLSSSSEFCFFLVFLAIGILSFPE